MPLNNPITSALLADPEIFQQNRLPFHAHFADQTSPEMPLTVSLDGEWNFRYAENLTAPFTDWDTLTVPGFIQMQSLQKPGQPYGTPHYVNTQYPWDGHEKLHPGEIPQDYNPIGEYQRSFTLPESWASCYLRLNGADSAAAVWCNGVYIGYTEDTFTPAEFDMTAAVHPGENTLTVQVYRFSSGSWLEDQDFWRMSGLFRSVELFTKPELHLEDVFVKQDFAPDFPAPLLPLIARSAARERCRWCLTARSSLLRWANLPNTTAAWCSAKVKPTRTWRRTCRMFPLPLRWSIPPCGAPSSRTCTRQKSPCCAMVLWWSAPG